MIATAAFDYLLTFVLVMTRMVAFVAVAPPFASRSVPARVKGILAAALTLPVFPELVKDVPAPETGPMLVALIFQVAIGLLMGFVVMIFTAALQSAGELMDLFSMFSMASLLDPISNTSSSMFGRVQQLLATTLLFSSGGHLLIVRGALSSFTLAPLRGPDVGGISKMLVSDVAMFFVSAIQICGPIIVVLFCTDLALGLVSRAVPSLNIFSLSFPVKSIITVALAGTSLSLLPFALESVVTRSLEQFQPLARLLGG